MNQTQVKVPWPGWQIAAPLGGGSFGSVYKIQRTISGVTEYAAMKCIRVPKEPGEVRELLESGYDLPSICQRYRADLDEIRKEYSLMAMLKGNANVVYCDDICDVPNPDGVGWTLYIRMELLKPLSATLADPFDEAQVIKVGMDLCNALAACKRKSILHRDIKPNNIMVAVDGNYKLGDFGVAKTMEGTTGGTKTGTYGFMAPEVYNNQPYGQSADIYSLGMVLYWMLNKRCGPFLPLPPTVPTASQIATARERRFGGEPLPAPAYGSLALQQIVLRACDFDPAQRYSSPEAMYDDLQALQSRKAESALHTWDDTDFGEETVCIAHAFVPTPHTDEKVPQPQRTQAHADDSWDNGDGNDPWQDEDDRTVGLFFERTKRNISDSPQEAAPAQPPEIHGQRHTTAQKPQEGCRKQNNTDDGETIQDAIPADTAPETVPLQETAKITPIQAHSSKPQRKPALKKGSGGMIFRVILALVLWPTFAAISGLWPMGFLMFLHPIWIISRHKKKQKKHNMNIIRNCLATNDKQTAIALYQEATGANPAEAKRAIEQMAEQISK